MSLNSITVNDVTVHHAAILEREKIDTVRKDVDAHSPRQIRRQPATSTIAPRLSLVGLNSFLEDETTSRSFFDRNNLRELLGFADARTSYPIDATGAREDIAYLEAGVRIGKADKCSKAEPSFVEAARQVEDPDGTTHKYISAYHDRNGYPVLFRKESAVSSALSLVGISFGDFTLPAGTIMYAGNETAQRTSTKKVGNTTFATYELSDAPTFTPMRLSPWAYDDPLDRLLYATRQKFSDELDFDPERGRIVSENTIDTFRTAAANVMAMCDMSLVTAHTLAPQGQSVYPLG